MNLPAGITTISGQSGQSRNTAPGTRFDVGPADAFAGAPLFLPCPNAVPVKMSTANRKKIRICSGLPELEKNELRLANLLIAESDHRIDFHGAARGEITGKHGNTEEKESDTGKGQRIGRPYAVEQTCHQVRNDQGTNKSNCGTHNGEGQSLA